MAVSCGGDEECSRDLARGKEEEEEETARSVSLQGGPTMLSSDRLER